MANYKAGDEVVCVDAMASPGTEDWPINEGAPGIELGRRYWVYHVDPITGCTQLDGIGADPDDYYPCTDCGSNEWHFCYASYRFVKISGLDALAEESATVNTTLAQEA